MTTRPFGRSTFAAGGAAIALLAIVFASVPVASPASEDADDVDRMEAEAGRFWYDKYCTPCHGVGGEPGSAVFQSNGAPVDLRRYVARNEGRFPAHKWIAVVEQYDLRSPHADVWEQIRRAQVTTSGQRAAARGIVTLIAEYVLSIQGK